jgi:hypothetical protein
VRRELPRIEGLCVVLFVHGAPRMNNTKLALVLGLVACVPGCSKDDKKGGASSSAKGADTGGGGGGSGPWKDWDMPARKAAFQGAWVGPGDSLAQTVAYNIEGTKITRYDGTAEKTLELEVRSPCEAAFTENRADGWKESTVHHYTVESGVLMLGLGNAGAKKGGAAIACVSNSIFTLDDKGTCLAWEEDNFDKGKYESKPGTCSFGKSGDQDVFKATVNGHESELEVHGDALYSEQLARDPLVKAADWAAAKAARDAKK